MSVKTVDIICDVAWGDCGKGKISHILSKRKNDDGSPFYDYVCRWNGGQNAGHTVYHNGRKFATHIVPSGVFNGIKSVIGPGCVLNIDLFYKELKELEEGGIDISLVKVSPNAHIVTDEHLKQDRENLSKSLGTTSRGIAPAYAAKFARTGLLAKDSTLDKKYLFTEELHGNLLCEGAQGFWLDINWGNYPYVTSSECLPYAACSLGFAPQKIGEIWGAAKIYDTRSGVDPLFPESLLDDPELSLIAKEGGEYGTTTGRARKVNWLNVDMLIKAIEISGVTHLAVAKCDILEKLSLLKMTYKGIVMEASSIEEMKEALTLIIKSECSLVEEIYYAHSPERLN